MSTFDAPPSFLRIALATSAYFLFVFGAGLVLGPVRVLWVEPKLGRAIAVLCETPFLLAAMTIAATWTTRRLQLRGKRRSLAAMGVFALLLQQIADLAVGRFLRSLTFEEQLAGHMSPEGLVYAVLLAAFAGMPTLVDYFADG